MSIVNYVLTPVRASVLTDTLAFDGRGEPRGLCSKIYAVPHVGMAATGRGSVFVLRALVDYLTETWLPNGMDDVWTQAPDVLQSAQEEFVSQFGGTLGESDPNGWLHHSEVMVFGWSERLHYVAGIAFNSFNGFSPSEMQRGVNCIPDPVVITNPPKPGEFLVQHARPGKVKIPEGLIAAAKLQKKAFAAAGERTVGGELVLTEITHNRVDMRVVHRFDDYHALVKEIEHHGAD